MAKALTQRQAEIYGFILEHIEENAFPPTVRDIAERFSLRSTNGVAQHLDALVRKGYLTRDAAKSRALRPMYSEDEIVIEGGRGKARPQLKKETPAFILKNEELPRLGSKTQLSADGRHREIPILGRIAAGNPVHAFEDHEETLSMDASLFARGLDEVYALRVRGTSMIGDGIMPGDIVFVRPQSSAEDGELIAAMVDGDATVKRFERHGKEVRLIPSNPDMAPIIIKGEELENFRILGSIRGVLRQYA